MSEAQPPVVNPPPVVNLHSSPDGAIRHPLNHSAVYSRTEDGTVLVTMGRRWGRFHPNGQWIEGPLFEADPELCLWVSAARPKDHHRLSRILEISGER
jgi:hypothetical protein